MTTKIWLLYVLELCLIELVFGQGTTYCPVRIQRLPHLKVYTDVCMLLVTNKVTGDDAKRSCARMGGRLVEIKDPDKEKFILQSLNQEHWTEDNIWIGANDKVHEGDWRWEDGTKVTFNRFADGQGNNHNTGFLFADGRGEDCAVIRRDDGGQWYDYPCSPPVFGIGYHYTYICEFAKVQHVQVTMTPTVTSTKNNIFTTEVQPSIQILASTVSTTMKDNWVTILTGHLNDNIILQCPFKQINGSQLLWHGPPNLQTVYADGSFTNPRISSIEIVGEQDEFNLKINSLSTFDVGRYRCTIIENGVKKTHDFELHVET